MLDEIGIVVKVDDCLHFAEYAKLRDRLATMHPFRRWLSFGLRRELNRLTCLVEAELMDQVMLQADHALD